MQIQQQTKARNGIFDFSIASATRDFNMASRERWYTTTEAMESIFLNSDSERDENSSNSDGESGGSEEAVASETGHEAGVDKILTRSRIASRIGSSKIKENRL